MSRQPLARQPYAWVLGLCVLVHVLGVLVAPHAWLWLSGKESVFEHLGHAVLLVACGAWAWVVHRSARRERIVALLVTTYLVFCFLEEIDWGNVYGIDLGYTRIEHWTGSPNLHNARALEHTILGWSLSWMTLPMVGYFATGLLRRVRWTVLATPTETLWFIATVVVSALFDSIHLLHWRLGYVPRAPAGGSLGDALGWFQIAFYFLWLLVGVRVAGQRARVDAA